VVAEKDPAGIGNCWILGGWLGRADAPLRLRSLFQAVLGVTTEALFILSENFHYARTVAFVSLGNEEPNSDAVPKFYVDAIAPFSDPLAP
jgi:hypothetical protein